MPSNDGSKGSPDEPMHPLEERALRSKSVSMTDFKAKMQELMAETGRSYLNPALTLEEQDRVADGEPYCFRCGKPASSFSEYREGARAEHLASARDYVCDQEGTYNDLTNRFACDACYIAIGQPTSPSGWVAP